jgi:sulfur-carrier protein
MRPPEATTHNGTAHPAPCRPAVERPEPGAAAPATVQIRLKLFAMLTRWLPPDCTDHTMRLELPAGATARTVVEKLHIPAALATLALVDGEHLTRDEFEHRVLREGETLALFPPIAGGC